MERVCVTGMSGALGSLLREPLGRRYALTALNRRPIPSARIVRADIGDARALEGAFEGHDAVVHLAARTWSDHDVATLFATNVRGTLNVLDEAARSGVRRFVFASTLAVYAAWRDEVVAFVGAHPRASLAERLAFLARLPGERPGEDDYAITKLYGEALCRRYAEDFEMGCVCLRIGQVRPGDPPESASPVETFSRCRAERWITAVEEALEQSRRPGFSITTVLSD